MIRAIVGAFRDAARSLEENLWSRSRDSLVKVNSFTLASEFPDAN
jgi:hypothetical protein